MIETRIEILSETERLQRELDEMKPKLDELNLRKFRCDAKMRFHLEYSRLHPNRQQAEDEFLRLAEEYAWACEEHAVLCSREQFLKWRKWTLEADSQPTQWRPSFDNLHEKFGSMMAMVSAMYHHLLPEVVGERENAEGLRNYVEAEEAREASETAGQKTRFIYGDER